MSSDCRLGCDGFCYVQKLVAEFNKFHNLCVIYSLQELKQMTGQQDEKILCRNCYIKIEHNVGKIGLKFMDVS